MSPQIDNVELNEIMNILEELADEALAVELLQEFNGKSKTFGKLIVNTSNELDHVEWKKQCDQAKSELDEVIAKIKALENS